jgi:hypothetical protein
VTLHRSRRSAAVTADRDDRTMHRINLMLAASAASCTLAAVAGTLVR